MSDSPRHAKTARLSVAIGLISCAGIVAAACQHSDEVLNAKFGAGITAPKYLVGLNPADALKPTAVTITTPPPAAPLADEAGRVACQDIPVGDLYKTDSAQYQEAQRLIAQMTPAQKVVQLTGLYPNYQDSNRWEDIQRSDDDLELKIPGYQWRDGPHGLNLESGQNRDPLKNWSTSFPTSVVQGASWDIDLVYRVGEAMGDETVASHNNVLLTPCMNLLRNPLWGRAQETFGEDPHHLGRIASELTRGLQTYVTGCAKHWLANNIENQRFSINAQMDEQTLRETYGRHFEMLVRDSGIGCVMASYNSVNGKKQTQNKHTLTNVLRYDFGFRGFVLTDWWAMPAKDTGQGPADPPNDLVVAAEALEAGLDVEVPWAINFDAIPSLLASGTVSQQTVDTAVSRVLEQKIRFNSAKLNANRIYGNRPAKSTYDETLGALVGPVSEEHAALAAEAAEKGAVLLKNDPAPSTSKKALPITKANGVNTVALVGATVKYSVASDRPRTKYFNFVTDAALGDRGSSRVRPNPDLVVGPLKGITAAAMAQGINVISATNAQDKPEEAAGLAAAAALQADVAIVIVGLTAGDEGEEYTGASDRQTLDLPAPHDDVVRAVLATGKPTIVVIEAGGAVDMKEWKDGANAIVMAWYPGQRAGTALGRLLFGQANFAGRLPVTWPRLLSDFPKFDEGQTTHMDYFAGYSWFDAKGIKPLYAFGHGLSYSTFSYERLHMPCGQVTSDGLINIEVDVRNVAGQAGDEVVEVYASYPSGPLTTPRRNKKELKGFARVNLAPGEAKRVKIPLRIRDLKYWDMIAKAWVVEKGPVLIQVGPSSDNLLLQQTLTVN
jgi:beta-glucosidase